MPAKKRRATAKKRGTKAWLLAGDIGATKTKLALFDLHGDLREAKNVQTFQGEEYAGLADVLREYLKTANSKVTAASFGVAGPVVDGRVQLTNLKWVVDAAKLSKEFGFKQTWLMNDLKAIANSVPILKPSELHVLNKGKIEKGGTIAVIAPGTGLGIGYLTWASQSYHAYATEGGHANFAPVNAIQDELLAFLRAKLDVVAVENVASGIGIPNVYEFLKTTGRAVEPDWLHRELSAADDVTAVIVQNGLDAQPGSELCQLTMEIFVSVLAAHCTNLGLGLGATGGIYVGGGIPPRILPLFERYAFMHTYLNKPKYQDYLARFPIKVILNVESGILGAAAYGRQQLA